MEQEVRIDEAVPLDEGVYWVGSSEQTEGLHCNPYLIIDNGEGVLIDPGSALDFEEVYRKVTNLLPIEQLSYIVLLHQDPDLASSTPLFEKRGFSGSVATHWRTTLFAVYYGINSPFYLVNENDFSLDFGSKRTLDFIPAPYLHFPGALMVRDEKTGILFSGDLFGSISKEWSLFAGEDYEEGMKTFHEHYMPSNEILRPVMELLLQREYPMICPQHGSIIRSDVRRYIEILRDLECGSLLYPIRKDLMEEGGYAYLMDQIIKRLITVFGQEEVLACFHDSPFVIDPKNGRPQSYKGKVEQLWNHFFERIYAHGGSRWITLLEPLLQRFEGEFGVPRPKIYLGVLAKEKRRAIDLQNEKDRLERVNESLRSNIELTYEEMTKDTVTGLYNEDFLVRYLLNIFNEAKWKDFTSLFIQVDGMKQINDRIGEEEGDDVLSGLGGLLFQKKRGEDYLFRLNGPVFLLIIPTAEVSEAEERGEYIRYLIANDRGFLAKVTASVAVIPVLYEKLGKMESTEAMNYLFSRGRGVLRDSLRQGGNRVIFDRGEETRLGMEGRVLVAEYDPFHAELIRSSLEKLSIEVVVSMNGPDVFSDVESFHPDVIISELFLPEIDAFTVKEELEGNSKTKDIPFVLVSHLKNEASVVRAQNLGIVHYLKKPYMLPELLGIVHRYVERALHHGT